MLAAGAGCVAFGLFASWRWYVNDQVEGSPASADRAALWGTVSFGALLTGTATAALGSLMLFRSRDSGAIRVGPVAGSSSASLLVSGAF